MSKLKIFYTKYFIILFCAVSIPVLGNEIFIPSSFFTHTIHQLKSITYNQSISFSGLSEKEELGTLFGVLNNVNPTVSAEGYNLFAENGATLRGGESEGPVALGGSLTVDGSYTIAGNSAGTFIATGESNPIALYIGGGINFISGNGINVVNNSFMKLGDGAGLNIHDIDQNGATANTRINTGDINANPRISLSIHQTSNSIQNAGLIDFGTSFAQFRNIATEISQLPTNNNLTIENGTRAKINLTANQVNVINLTGSELTALNEFIFENQPSSTQPLVINIDASGTLNWQPPNFSAIGDAHGKYILLNFYNSTDLTIIGGTTINGTVLIPNGHCYKNNSGNINGQVIAKSFDMTGGELHYYVFDAAILSGAVTPTPTPTTGAGNISFERFSNITGKGISDLTSNGNYPDNPSESGIWTELKGPTNYADNYGTRLRGYLHPTETGNHIFAVVSDDASEVYLSTDENPANKVKIAEVTGWTTSDDFTKFTGQVSTNVALTAGERYYLEVLHKEGDGGDHLAVYWQTPSVANRTVIDGAYLSPFNNTNTNLSCATSILNNADFESGLSDWDIGSATTTAITTDAYFGAQAVVNTGSDGGVQQALAGTPGTAYYLSTYAKKTGDTNPVVGIEFYDSSWGYISGYHMDVTATSWTEYTHSVIAPANTAYVMFSGRNNSGNGSAYFDGFCTDSWTFTPPTCATSCLDLMPYNNQAIWVMDDSGNDSNTLEYDNVDLILVDNEDGTLTIRGNIFNGRGASWHTSNGTTCGTQDGWQVELKLTDKQSWAEFQGPYEQTTGCGDRHVDWDYWDLSGTLTGIGCNAGRTINMIPHVNGYRMQVGSGGNAQSCDFGMSTWFLGDENGTQTAFNLYAHIDSIRYTAMVPPVVEICGNNIDDDGDLLIDEDCPTAGNCPNSLTNQEFNNGVTDWWMNAHTGATAVYTIDNTNQLSGANASKIAISATSGTDWHIQFGQSGKQIEAGKIYTVSFDAKAAANRKVSVMLQIGADPWTTYWWREVSLTTSPTTYTYTFHANHTLLSNLNLLFNLGGSEEDVWFDNIYFGEVCETYEICDNGIDDDGDGLIDCADPDCSLLSNGGVEEFTDFSFSTILEGNPAEKLNDGGNMPEWFAGLAGTCMYYVNDTEAQVNNPEGDFFVWLPQTGDCFINRMDFENLAMVDGTDYTISFHAASWDISLDGSCNPDGGTATQASGSVILELEDPSYNNTVVANYIVPQSTSWANLNWQKYTYTFTYNAATHLKFAITNNSNKGLAVDGVILSKADCVPHTPELCDNGIDDDGNGLTDIDCPCVGNEVTTINQTNIGVSNPENAVGLPNGNYADIRSDDVLTLDLGEEVAAGEVIEIYITRGNSWGRVTIEGATSETTGYTGGIVWGNPSNSNTTVDATVGELTYEIVPFSVPNGGIRYIRLTRNAGQIRVDGVRYCGASITPEICDNGIDDDGDGDIDNCDSDCNPYGDVNYDGIKWTITPMSFYEDLTEAVFIDGYTQTGSVEGTNSTAAMLKIKINGENLSANGAIFQTTADGNKLAGMAIGGNDASNSSCGVNIQSANNEVVGNCIGVETDGATAFSNGTGIIVNGSNNKIGGPNGADALYRKWRNCD